MKAKTKFYLFLMILIISIIPIIITFYEASNGTFVFNCLSFVIFISGCIGIIISTSELVKFIEEESKKFR